MPGIKLEISVNKPAEITIPWPDFGVPKLVDAERGVLEVTASLLGQILWWLAE